MGGHIRKKGDRYYVVIEGELDPGTGSRKRLSFPGGIRRRDAERMLVELLEQQRVETFVEPDKLTLGVYLVSEWLPLMSTTLRPSTLDAYRRSIDIHINPQLGAIPLQRVRPIELTKVYGEWVRAGRRDGTGGLSIKTVRNLHMIIRKALDDAVELGYLSRNPAIQAKPPKVSSTKSKPMRSWTVGELNAFLDSCMEADPHSTLWHLAAYTGMRRGELLGLRWCDVDLGHARLAVRHTIVSVGYQILESDPKTSRGERTIDLDSTTIAVLTDHRLAMEERATSLRRSADALVFARPDGSPLHPDLVRQSFGRAVGRAPVSRIRFHDLRHTHASLLLMAGVPPKVVSERLGHATVAFTMDVYAHVIPGMQAEAAKAFDAMMRQTDPPTET